MFSYEDVKTFLFRWDGYEDLAANAESLGARVIRVKTIEEFRAAIATARAAEHTTAIHIETDPLAPVPSSESWWDVPVSEVAALDSTRSYLLTKKEKMGHLLEGF